MSNATKKTLFQHGYNLKVEDLPSTVKSTVLIDRPFNQIKSDLSDIVGELKSDLELDGWSVIDIDFRAVPRSTKRTQLVIHAHKDGKDLDWHHDNIEYLLNELSQEL